jgi:hypothetical protein
VHTVIETSAYLSDAKAVGLSDDERAAVVALVSGDPLSGDLMVGTGGARKIRFAGRGKGKSGGYRVISFFGGGDIPVFLLAVFGKGERANLSKAERNALAIELHSLAGSYRTKRRMR